MIKIQIITGDKYDKNIYHDYYHIQLRKINSKIMKVFPFAIYSLI